MSNTANHVLVRALARLMSEISESFYFAGWMDNLEFDLFGIVRGDRFPTYGMGTVDDTRIQELRSLSEMVGGWVVFRDDEQFVPMSEWQPLYEKHRDEYLAKGWWPCSTGRCLKHHPQNRDKKDVMGLEALNFEDCGYPRATDQRAETKEGSR